MSTLFDQFPQTPSVPHRGVQSVLPFSTPKYKMTNRTTETQARLFVPVVTWRQGTNLSAQLADQPKLAQSVLTGGGYNSNGYIDFLLTSAQEAYTEKVQIVDVLSDNYMAYFFGAAPAVFNYSGMVYNTMQDDWRSALTILYQTYLRGTKLARNRTVVCLAYDEVLVTGAILNMSQNLVAETQTAAQFSFSLLVKDYQRVSPRKTFYPTQSAGISSQLIKALDNVVSGIVVKTSPTRASMKTQVVADPTVTAAQAAAQKVVDDAADASRVALGSTELPAKGEIALTPAPLPPISDPNAPSGGNL